MKKCGFSFRGTHSNKFGITAYTKSRPIVPERKSYMYEVSHRDGSYDFSSANEYGHAMYKDRTFSMVLQISAPNIMELQKKLGKIAVWLMGEGELIFDDLPECVWNAKCITSIDYAPDIDEKIILKEAETTSFDVSFDVEPFAKAEETLKKKVTLTSTSETIKLYNPGSWYAKPTIKLSGFGAEPVTLSCGGKSLTVRRQPEETKLDVSAYGTLTNNSNCNRALITDGVLTTNSGARRADEIYIDLNKLRHDIYKIKVYFTKNNATYYWLTIATSDDYAGGHTDWGDGISHVNNTIVTVRATIGGYTVYKAVNCEIKASLSNVTIGDTSVLCLTVNAVNDTRIDGRYITPYITSISSDDTINTYLSEVEVYTKQPDMLDVPEDDSVVIDMDNISVIDSDGNSIYGQTEGDIFELAPGKNEIEVSCPNLPEGAAVTVEYKPIYIYGV